MNIKKEILKTIKYFSIFTYYPTSEEIHTFLELKISKNGLKKEIKKMVVDKLIEKYARYTVGEYSIGRIKSLELRIKNSKIKLNNWRFRAYIKLISLFSQIKLVGLSGSISMMNAEEGDDIDLFIITAKNRLFTGRLIAIAMAQILGLRRSRKIEKLDTIFSTATPPWGPLAIVSKKVPSLLTIPQSLKPNPYKNKVCLNLFFDERELKVPKYKQTLFVGHEVLQMKPLVAKGDIYERFLEANEWVFRIFSNAKENLEFKIKNSESKKRIISSKLLILNFGRIIELILKKIQLNSINKHRTTEIITDSQLWFHPDDFEKKIKY